MKEFRASNSEYEINQVSLKNWNCGERGCNPGTVATIILLKKMYIYGKLKLDKKLTSKKFNCKFYLLKGEGISMQKLNLGTRVEMFSICTSLEYDIKQYIISMNSKIKFTEEMSKKANERKKNIENEEDILNQLDLGDFVSIIVSSPHEYKINMDKAKNFQRYFEHIIPVRNRVMHTKPLELGDRALLIEVMQEINESIPWLEWKELKNTRKIIEEDSSKLLARKYIGLKEYNPKVFHNLPLPEFDDTGFVGRKKDVKEITELILNKKNQVISVVGNGGMGKTSTVIKILYDLIEKPENPFEAVIWLTLKTKTLSHGEFVEIKDGIKEISEVIEKSKQIMVSDGEEDAMSCVIEFMETFNVLLVLDNLETINTGDINEFLRKIPENSKVLITSRLGIGEFEIRQKIDGLERQDAIAYYRELSKYYGLELHKQSDNEIYEIINKNLYNNPLSIKWYISGIYSGTSPKQMLSHKDDLIEFCISNIFDKLSQTSRTILQLFLLENVKLTYGVIDYYIDENELTIRNSINELLSTYMIQASSGEYIMNDMSREYISLNYPPDNEFIKEVFTKRKKLKDMLQQVKVYSEQAPFNPNTVSSKLSDVDKQLATYHLRNALKYGKEKRWDECQESINKATSIEPDFFEVYKVKAFLEAEKGELYGAIYNYNISLQKCNTNKERAIVCYLFSVFYTVKMQDIDSALEYIQKADKYLPNTNEIILEKVRVFTFIGKYDEAEQLWIQAKELDMHPNLRTLNIMANRYMDLKRRQAGILQNRDYVERFNLIKQGIGVLDDIGSIDDKTTVTLLKLLTDLSFFYFYDEAIELLVNTLQKYSYAISKIDKKNKERILTNIEEHKGEIDKEKYKIIYTNLSEYKAEANSIINDNEGVVVKMKDTYGFISNATHSPKNGLFFSKNNAYEYIKVGDRVKFERYNTLKGEAARNVEKCKDIE